MKTSCALLSVSSTRIRSASVSKKCVVLSIGVFVTVVACACDFNWVLMAQTFRNLKFLDKQSYSDFSFFSVQNRLRNVHKNMHYNSSKLRTLTYEASHRAHVACCTNNYLICPCHHCLCGWFDRFHRYLVSTMFVHCSFVHMFVLVNLCLIQPIQTFLAKSPFSSQCCYFLLATTKAPCFQY